ncbi:DJ-1/PfpI family protein [Labilibacter marinus]|uniref:DJ-1/PfpI family protein n=1 Tax=Labilibacter marinus TaxID=1477105 RepID=UPI00094F84B6|nr:DJ-1/PfpI family protein [Labilibacter marinus]
MKNKKVLLFLAQGFEEYEAGVFTDVIGWSRVLGDEPVDMITTGLRTEIKCKWNFNVRPEIEFDKIDTIDYDALAIPGGFEDAGYYEDVFDERFLSLIREFDKDEKIIAAVCAAAIPVGKSGVLRDRNATTYDLYDGYRRKQLADFGANVQDKHIVVDKHIITSTGPATGLDVSFKLLEMLTSTKNVDEVKKYMRFTHK